MPCHANVEHISIDFNIFQHIPNDAAYSIKQGKWIQVEFSHKPSAHGFSQAVPTLHAEGSLWSTCATLLNEDEAMMSLLDMWQIQSW
jgi:hypothetical protein